MSHASPVASLLLVVVALVVVVLTVVVLTVASDSSSSEPELLDEASVSIGAPSETKGQAVSRSAGMMMWMRFMGSCP